MCLYFFFLVAQGELFPTLTFYLGLQRNFQQQHVECKVLLKLFLVHSHHTGNALYPQSSICFSFDAHHEYFSYDSRMMYSMLF